MKLSNAARKTATMGEIVNIMSVDCMKLQDLMTYVNTIWSSPLQIVLAIVFLYKELGPSVFAGVAVMITIIPLNAVFAVFQKKLQVSQLHVYQRFCQLVESSTRATSLKARYFC